MKLILGSAEVPRKKVGLKLKEAAANRQVLCVTHSAQIAALGNHQFSDQERGARGQDRLLGFILLTLKEESGS